MTFYAVIAYTMSGRSTDTHIIGFYPTLKEAVYMRDLVVGADATDPRVNGKNNTVRYGKGQCVWVNAYTMGVQPRNAVSLAPTELLVP